MTQRRLLGAILLLMALDGAVEGSYVRAYMVPPLAWTVPLSLSFSFLCFAWYRADSDAHGFRRSLWQNVGVLALAPVGVPVYLLRSRPAGARARALWRLAGFAVLMLLSTAAGMVAVSGGVRS